MRSSGVNAPTNALSCGLPKSSQHGTHWQLYTEIPWSEISAGAIVLHCNHSQKLFCTTATAPKVCERSDSQMMNQTNQRLSEHLASIPSRDSSVKGSMTVEGAGFERPI
jgi:hypothetical protein